VRTKDEGLGMTWRKAREEEGREKKREREKEREIARVGG